MNLMASPGLEPAPGSNTWQVGDADLPGLSDPNNECKQQPFVNH